MNDQFITANQLLSNQEQNGYIFGLDNEHTILKSKNLHESSQSLFAETNKINDRLIPIKEENRQELLINESLFNSTTRQSLDIDGNNKIDEYDGQLLYNYLAFKENPFVPIENLLNSIVNQYDQNNSIDSQDIINYLSTTESLFDINGNNDVSVNDGKFIHKFLSLKDNSSIPTKTLLENIFQESFGLDINNSTTTTTEELETYLTSLINDSSTQENKFANIVDGLSSLENVLTEIQDNINQNPLIPLLSQRVDSQTVTTFINELATQISQAKGVLQNTVNIDLEVVVEQFSTIRPLA